jgi:IS4 transposase
VRRLAELRRLYQRVAGVTVEESSFYDRFTPALSAMLSTLIGHVLQLAWGAARPATGRLSAFGDILAADSTVIRLHHLLAKRFAGTRTNQGGAALKAHVVFAVTGAGKQTVQLTPERRSDRRTFQLGPWVRGKLLLIDLGYFDYRLLARIEELGGYYIIRAKKSINPIVVDCHLNHSGNALQVVRERLQDVIGKLRRSVLDVQVALRVRRRSYRGRRRTTPLFVRAVGVREEQRCNYHVYLTNIPSEDLDAKDIASTYALRWEIELLFRELKTHYRLAQVPSTKPHVVEVLIKASFLCLAASRALLRRAEAALADVDNRPLPRQRWAALFARCADDILLCVVLDQAPRRLEQDLQRLLLHEAPDPNRRRPLLETVEQATHTFGPRRVHPGHVKSALRAA